MKIFGDAMRRRFEDEAVALLRTEFPKTTAGHPDEKLRHFVNFGIERAARYGVVAVTDVQRWLRLMMSIGPSFDEDPRLLEIRTILAKTDVSAQFRLDDIELLAARFGTVRE